MEEKQSPLMAKKSVGLEFHWKKTGGYLKMMLNFFFELQV